MQHFSPFFDQLIAANPDLTIQLFHGAIEELEEMLQLEQIEAAILAYPSDHPPPYSLIPLSVEDIVLSAAPAHKVTALDTIRPDAICNYRYLARNSCEMQGYIDDQLQDMGISLTPALSSSEDQMILSLVQSGAGLSFVPRKTSAAYRLTTIDVEGLAFQRQVAFCEPPGRPRQPGMTQLITLLRQHDWNAPQV